MATGQDKAEGLRKGTMRYISISSVLVAILFLPQLSQACDYYASPTGTGNGLSQSSPFKISNFWSKASPGKTLCLLNGTYSGSDSLIQVPSGVNGTSGNPITIKALNDGAALIQGFDNWGGRPLDIASDYIIVEGVNVKLGDNYVIGMWGNNSILRRIIAWNSGQDTGVANGSIIGMAGQNNVIEDCALFGKARKVVSVGAAGAGGGSANNVMRRCWGRWEERSTGDSGNPGSLYEQGYGQDSVLFENLLGTWDTKGNSSEPNGIAEVFRSQNSKWLGSIFYLRGDEVYNPGSMFNGYLDGGSNAQGGTYHTTKNVLLKHLVAYVPSNYSTVVPIHLSFGSDVNPNDTNKDLNNRLEDSVGIGQANSFFQTGGNLWWKTLNFRNVKTAASADIWNTVPGVCKRYVDGTLTSQGLWPWPMNQRLISALQQAGYTGKDVVDVTATMETIFGSIPSQCKSSGSGDTQAPSPPQGVRLLAQ